MAVRVLRNDLEWDEALFIAQWCKMHVDKNRKVIEIPYSIFKKILSNRFFSNQNDFIGIKKLKLFGLDVKLIGD